MKKLLIAALVALSLAGTATALYADDSLFCAVCYSWGKDSPLWIFFLCSPQCDGGSASGN